MNEIVVKPTYWASVSGGKDSLYMLKLILANLDKYPLNGVVHFELEIDYPFIKNVIDQMEKMCNAINVPFVKIKPEISWFDLYQKYHFPTGRVKWCNDKYKLNAKKQLEIFLKNQGLKCYHYIGYCADEIERYYKRSNNEIYPLVDFNIREGEIWKWAKNIELFNDYYKINKRCGCMFCPQMSRLELAYLYLYYPDKYQELKDLVTQSERKLSEKMKRPIAIFNGNAKYNFEYIDNKIKNKWVNEVVLRGGAPWQK